MVPTLAYLIVTAIFVYPLWVLCGRVGRRPALSLIAVVPYVGFPILAFLLAYGPWPAYDNRVRRG